MKHESSYFGPQDNYASPNYTSEQKQFRNTISNDHSAASSPVNMDTSARKIIIKTIASKIHSKHMYNTNGFSKLGFNVNKIEEFAKNQLKGKTKITSKDIDQIDRKLHQVLSKAGDDVLKSNRSMSKSRSPSLN